MLTKRIIPCLDVRDGRVVKGVNFKGVQDVEDPVVLARRYNDAIARVKCLQGIIDDVGTGQQTLLVIEQDDSLIRSDRQHLIEMVRSAGCRDTLRYEHRRAKSELLLAVPDAIAWCWARGGPWRELISSITTIKEV